MQLNAFSKSLKTVGSVLNKNSPTILTGISVAGLISTAVLAVRATPKAIRLLDEEEERLYGYKDSIRGLTKKEIIQTTWKLYLPAVISGAITIACIIGSNQIHLKRNAALASAYGISQKLLDEYQKKVVDVIGESKEEKIRDEINQDRVDKNPPEENKIILTGNGDVLCCDTLFGRYFRSDMESLRQAVNDINQEFLREGGIITLNDFYYRIGMSNIPFGDYVGWDIQDGLIDVGYSATLYKNEPCIAMNFKIKPIFI